MKLRVFAAVVVVLLAFGISPASAEGSMAAVALPVESPRDATYLVEAEPIRHVDIPEEA